MNTATLQSDGQTNDVQQQYCALRSIAVKIDVISVTNFDN